MQFEKWNFPIQCSDEFTEFNLFFKTQIIFRKSSSSLIQTVLYSIISKLFELNHCEMKTLVAGKIINIFHTCTVIKFCKINSMRSCLVYRYHMTPKMWHMQFIYICVLYAHQLSSIRKIVQLNQKKIKTKQKRQHWLPKRQDIMQELNLIFHQKCRKK